MKAIVTKYHGPTNNRGSRITASDGDGNRVTISYPYELSNENVHRAAAEALCKKMNWTGRLVAGGLKRGYVFVFAEVPKHGDMRDVPIMGCDGCGLETVDVCRRYGGRKLCDLCADGLPAERKI